MARSPLFPYLIPTRNRVS